MPARSVSYLLLVLVCGGLAALIVGACGTDRVVAFDDPPPVADSNSFGSADAEPPCGLKCQIPKCEDGGTTTISGTAYAPNGQLPLYNVIVFVPNAPLAKLTDQLSCDQCGKVSGNPIVSTTSDASGRFELKGVPAGDDIPLVLQVGKWRRKVSLAHVAPCTETKLTDPELSRLPAKQSEGDMPHIAVTTGGCDSIGCILPKMGIDPSEFGGAADIDTKRVIFYKGADEGNSSPFEGAGPAQSLWGDLTTLSKFDTAIFSCECDEYPETKPDPARSVVSQYLDKGGRVFTTDYGYTWIHGSERPGTTITPPPSPMPSIMEGFRGGAPQANPGTYTIDTTFPKGAALNTWLHMVDPSSPPNEISLSRVYRNFDRANPTFAQRWIHGVEDRVFSFTTPLASPEDQRCGKGFFLDMHVSSQDVIHSPSTGNAFPKSCGTEPLTPQEKLMVFFLMDLASCIQNDADVIVMPK